jgi:hypothetical protein
VKQNYSYLLLVQIVGLPINIGTSGAEIGGAFGEKIRVADVSLVLMHGKCMRRQTINYTTSLPFTRNKI